MKYIELERNINKELLTLSNIQMKENIRTPKIDSSKNFKGKTKGWEGKRKNFVCVKVQTKATHTKRKRKTSD